jgi:fatty acyl-CoA reductase
VLLFFFWFFVLFVKKKVTATVKEPMEGWVDNLNGGSGALLAHGAGFLGKTLGTENAIIDWIPVDYIANLLLAAAWKLGTQK